MRALKRERNGSVSSRIRRDEKKRSCPDEKICAGKERIRRSLEEVHRIQNKYYYAR